MIWKLVALAVAAAALFGGGFLTGAKVESENWVAIVANLDAELEQLKVESAERVKRDAAASRRIVAEKRVEEMKREAEREAWGRQLRADWESHIAERVRAAQATGAADAGAALSTCRAENTALRSGLERVLAAGEHARKACESTELYVDALLGWLNHATR